MLLYLFALYACISNETVLSVAAFIAFFLINLGGFCAKAASNQENTVGLLSNQIVLSFQLGRDNLA